jgi:hypothetical protein
MKNNRDKQNIHTGKLTKINTVTMIMNKMGRVDEINVGNINPINDKIVTVKIPKDMAYLTCVDNSIAISLY